MDDDWLASKDWHQWKVVYLANKKELASIVVVFRWQDHKNKKELKVG